MRWVKVTFWVAAPLIVAAGIGLLLRPVSCFNGMLFLKDALAGMKSRTIPVNGYRVHYLSDGPDNGPAVVLIHGLGGHAEDWRNLAPYLTRAGFRVLMPDLPGYGRSQRPAEFSYSVRDEAGIVIGFLDALGLKQVDLGGWSMGGWIVQIAAAEAPQRVNRLMLFDAAGLDAAPDWDTRLFMPTTATQLKELEDLLTPHPQTIPGFVSRDLLRLSQEHRWVMSRALASMLTGRDVTDSLLPQLKMPVLIVWGQQDRIVPVSQADKMHQLIPQSELDIITGCGHLAPLECAGRVAPQVIEFVKQ
ncbi:MAG TPA: alpha/beta fold hydrolase [Terracidiphilus sp.]|jgi:pimeloyl-ACP methyl ester carboxylesterase